MYPAAVARFRAETDEQRTERHWQLVSAVEQNLLGAGYRESYIEFLALAFVQKGGGRRLLQLDEERRIERVEELTRLYLDEADIHDRLHAVLGRLGRSGLNPERWDRPVGRTARVDAWDAPSCRVRKRCESPFEEVRRHADFVRWLGKMAQDADEAGPLLTLAEVEPELTSKATIVALLRDEPAVPYEAIAAFVLVRGHGKLPPLDEEDLVKTTKKLRQLPIDQRRGQDRIESGGTTLARSRSRSASGRSDARTPEQERGRKTSKAKSPEKERPGRR